MTASGPRVLVLDEELPHPVDTGKRLRTWNLLTRLAPEFRITLLVHGRGVTPAARAAIEDRGIRVIAAPSGLPPKSGAEFTARVLANLAFSRLPYSVASHRRPGYATAVDEHAGSFDLVHCEWTPYAVYLDDETKPAVVAAHNVEAQVWKRLAEAEPGSLRGRVFAIQAARMARFERGVFSRIPFATAVSEPDGAAIRAMGARDVRVVPNGVDPEFFDPAEDPGEPDTLVFTGSMDWRPNQDAIRWFAEALHPRLSARRAGYRLLVVGRNPPGWMRSLAPAITIVGTVPDVRPYIRRGRVYVTPLRAGGGSRLKILEALAMRRAVVSTTVGAEGLDLIPGEHLLLADDPDAFVDAVIGLLDDPESRTRLGSAGRERVQTQYHWDRIAGIQAALWHEAAGRG